MGVRVQVDHFERAERMRRNPEQWVVVREASMWSSAVALATAIRHRSPAYPAYRNGMYETRVVRDEDGTPQVQGRWMGVGR